MSPSSSSSSSFIGFLCFDDYFLDRLHRVLFNITKPNFCCLTIPSFYYLNIAWQRIKDKLLPRNEKKKNLKWILPLNEEITTITSPLTASDLPDRKHMHNGQSAARAALKHTMSCPAGSTQLHRNLDSGSCGRGGEDTRCKPIWKNFHQDILAPVLATENQFYADYVLCS